MKEGKHRSEEEEKKINNDRTYKKMNKTINNPILNEWEILEFSSNNLSKHCKKLKNSQLIELEDNEDRKVKEEPLDNSTKAKDRKSVV